MATRYHNADELKYSVVGVSDSSGFVNGSHGHIFIVSTRHGHFEHVHVTPVQCVLNCRPINPVEVVKNLYDSLPQFVHAHTLSTL